MRKMLQSSNAKIILSILISFSYLQSIVTKENFKEWTHSTIFYSMLESPMREFWGVLSPWERRKWWDDLPSSSPELQKRVRSSRIKNLALSFPQNADVFSRNWTIRRETSGHESGGGEDSMQEQSPVLQSQPSSLAMKEVPFFPTCLCIAKYRFILVYIMWPLIESHSSFV